MRSSIPLTWRRIPERYRIIGTKCTTCNVSYFPTRVICPKCRRKGKIEKTEFSGKGKIFSFTEISSAPAGFEEQAPYVLALVELDEGPRLTTQIGDVRGSELKIGDTVKAVFRSIQRDDPEGLIHYGFKFKLAK